MRDWEQCYRDGNTPWDKGGSAPPLAELCERHGIAIWGGGPVLVPGCGMGHDVRALAAMGLEVVGVDLAPTAVAMAAGMPAVGSERYEEGDFLDPQWRQGRTFSAIWEHTCFCAIDPALRQRYAEAAAGLLGEGGVFAGVFYLDPHKPGESQEGPPFGVTADELDELFRPWFDRVDGWVPTTAYPGREGREWLAVFKRRDG